MKKPTRRAGLLTGSRADPGGAVHFCRATHCPTETFQRVLYEDETQISDAGSLLERASEFSTGLCAALKAVVQQFVYPRLRGDRFHGDNSHF
jgi:hypothetical protein